MLRTKCRHFNAVYWTRRAAEGRLGVNLWLCPTMPFVPTLPLQPSIVSTCTVQRHPGPTLFFFFSFQCNQKCRSTHRCMTNSAPKSMHYNVPLFQSFVAYFPEICGATKFGSAYHCKADSANSFANLKFVLWCVCLFFVAYTSSKHINIQLTEQITVRMGLEIFGRAVLGTPPVIVWPRVFNTNSYIVNGNFWFWFYGCYIFEQSQLFCTFSQLAK